MRSLHGLSSRASEVTRVQRTRAARAPRRAGPRDTRPKRRKAEAAKPRPRAPGEGVRTPSARDCRLRLSSASFDGSPGSSRSLRPVPLPRAPCMLRELRSALQWFRTVMRRCSEVFQLTVILSRSVCGKCFRLTS